MKPFSFLAQEILLNGFAVIAFDKLQSHRPELSKTPFPSITGFLAIVGGIREIHLDDVKWPDAEHFLVKLDGFIDALHHNGNLAEACRIKALHSIFDHLR